MIRNERQYRVTKAQLDRFDKALLNLRRHPDRQIDPVIHKAQLDAVEGQANTLRKDVLEYEALLRGSPAMVNCSSLSEIPEALVKARIAAGLSQRDLAVTLGVKEQQIQRYEATNYASASFDRITKVADALSVQIPSEVRFGATSVSFPAVLRKLSGIGLNKEFLTRRILPARHRETGDVGDAADVSNLVSSVSRIFGWNPDELLSPGSIHVDPRPIAHALFKLPARVNETRLAAYTVYAHYLSQLLLQAFPVSHRAIPTDPAVVRRHLLAKGELTFQTALEFVWDQGIPVLPLADPGTFHGAMWRIAGRNVIVIKQGIRSQTRWLFDLLHELRHAAEAPESSDFSVLEGEGITIPLDEAEQRASCYAGDVLLDCRAEELVGACVSVSDGKVERLKGAVQRIATSNRVSTSALANYLAYRLSLQGINWWGAANNLQDRDIDPWLVARDYLLTRIDTATLLAPDRSLLSRALSDYHGDTE